MLCEVGDFCTCGVDRATVKDNGVNFIDERSFSRRSDGGATAGASAFSGTDMPSVTDVSGGEDVLEDVVCFVANERKFGLAGEANGDIGLHKYLESFVCASVEL